MKKYDEQGNLIYKSGKGYKYWYDSQGNMVHFKDSTGHEWFRKEI